MINDFLKKKGMFLDELKLAETLYRKADPSDKTNYRLISFLSHVSKE